MNYQRLSELFLNYYADIRDLNEKGRYLFDDTKKNRYSKRQNFIYY